MTKLHIGCGSKKLEGYINVDLRKTSAADVVVNILSPDFKEMFKPNSVDEIYSCHMLEHIPESKAKIFLADCLTILKLGGILNIEIPLIDRLIDLAWKDGKCNHKEILYNIYGMERWEGDFHMFGYTTKVFKELVAELGYEFIKEEVGRTGYPNYKTGSKFWMRKPK